MGLTSPPRADWRSIGSSLGVNWFETVVPDPVPRRKTRMFLRVSMQCMLYEIWLLPAPSPLGFSMNYVCILGLEKRAAKGARRDWVVRRASSQGLPRLSLSSPWKDMEKRPCFARNVGYFRSSWLSLRRFIGGCRRDYFNFQCFLPLPMYKQAFAALVLVL